MTSKSLLSLCHEGQIKLYCYFERSYCYFNDISGLNTPGPDGQRLKLQQMFQRQQHSHFVDLSMPLDLEVVHSVRIPLGHGVRALVLNGHTRPERVLRLQSQIT